jgi:cytochrome c oxidase subunit 2
LAKGCVACHTVAGVPGGNRIGPDLTGMAAAAGARKPGMDAEAYVRESLVQPQAFVVPGYGGSGNSPGNPQMPVLPLTEADVDALVAFLLAPGAAR